MQVGGGATHVPGEAARGHARAVLRFKAHARTGQVEAFGAIGRTAGSREREAIPVNVNSGEGSGVHPAQRQPD